MTGKEKLRGIEKIPNIKQQFRILHGLDPPRRLTGLNIGFTKRLAGPFKLLFWSQNIVYTLHTFTIHLK